MKFAWLGVYTAGDNADNPHASTCSAGYCGNGHYLLYEYTNASIEGSTTFGPASQVGYKTWPLGTGNYEIRLLLDDGYRSAAPRRSSRSSSRSISCIQRKLPRP